MPRVPRSPEMDAAADLVADSALGGAFESMSKRFLVDAEEVDEDELVHFCPRRPA